MPRTLWILAGILSISIVVFMMRPGRKPAPPSSPVRPSTDFPALLARLLEGDADARRISQEAGVRPDDPAFLDRLARLCADAPADFGLGVCAARLLTHIYGLAGYGLKADATALLWERRDTLALPGLKFPPLPVSPSRASLTPLLVAALEEGPLWPADGDRADQVSRRLAAVKDTALMSYLLSQVGTPGRRQAVYGLTLARMGRPEGRAWLLTAAQGRRPWGGALVAGVLKESRDAQALRALKEGLRDGQPWMRLRSAELLARLGDLSGAEALRSLISNPASPYLSVSAAGAAADLGLKSSIPALRASASRQRGYGLFAVVDALSRLGDEEGVRAVIDTLLSRPESRAAGVHLAGQLKDFGFWILDFGMKDRQGSKSAIRNLQSEIDLRPFLADPDTVVRFYAGEAMKEQARGNRQQAEEGMRREATGNSKSKRQTEGGGGLMPHASGLTPDFLPQASRLTPSFHKGISIDGWRVQRVTPEALGELEALGVNAISYLPFGYQDEDDRPALREGEFEQYRAVLAACANAHRAGMRIAIKPHLWVRERDTWHGRIAMKNEADWKTWFEGYCRMVLKFAAVAEAGGADLFCVGTELSGTSGREADWRALIREVRAVYGGPLTYAANWDGEAERVAFWDALDFIGIDAYYPLTDRPAPSANDLVAAWGPILGRIEELHRKYDRPVLFMEVGYPATEGAARAPYREERDRPLDLMGQAACYEALFRACLGRPWMAGMYLWRWNDPDWRSGPWDPSYNLRDKPAVAVIRKWYGGRI